MRTSLLFAWVMATCLLHIGCQEPKSTHFHGVYASMMPWTNAMAFKGDTMIVFSQYGGFYKRYLHKVERGILYRGQFIDDGHYPIVHLSRKPKPASSSDIRNNPPSPIPLRAVAVDSNQLNYWDRTHEVLVGQYDTLLSSLYWNEQFREKTPTNLSLVYKIGTPKKPVWNQIELARFCFWNGTEDFQVKLNRTGEYAVKWLDGRWRGRISKGRIDPKWMELIDTSIQNYEYFDQPSYHRGSTSDAEEFFLSIGTGRRATEYYFESAPLPSIISLTFSLIISEIEYEKPEWIEEEIEFLNIGERILAMCK